MIEYTTHAPNFSININILPFSSRIRYKKNLKAFYIVHPTFWTKMMTWWFLTFMAPAIKSKVHQLPGVEHLYAAMTRDQLEIPAYITEYDMAVSFSLHCSDALKSAAMLCDNIKFILLHPFYFDRQTVYITSNRQHIQRPISKSYKLRITYIVSK